jgi:hypothetical protein
MSSRIAAILVVLITPFLSNAASLSWTGNFAQDDDLQFFTLTLNNPSTITIVTMSYAGGTNAAGSVIPRGGFDPVLSLFDSAGNLVGVNNDGGCPAVGQDAVTNACWDALLMPSLIAGTYTVVLSEADNSASGPTLADGFLRQGQGNFTGPNFVGMPGSFWDVNPDQRTSAWALDIRDVDAANISGVPEPATGVLMTGLCIVGALSRLRLRSRELKL